MSRMGRLNDKISGYERLRFERRDNGVLLITMDRPEVYSAADEARHAGEGVQ